MKNVLYISAHFPSESSRLAGHKCAYKILKEYDDKANVDLVVASNSDELDSRFSNDLQRTRLVLFSPLTRLAKLANIIRSKRILPLKVWSRYSRPVAVYLRENISRYDVIHFEFSHAAAVFREGRKLKQPGQVWVVTCHDILIQALLRQHGRFAALKNAEIAATFSFESELFEHIDLINVFSDKDAHLIRSLYAVPAEKVRVVRPYISAFTSRVLAARSQVPPQKNTLLFWGAMNRRENDEAVLLFAKRFGAELKAGGFVLYVVGNEPSPTLKQLASDYIIVTGFVEDPADYFARCALGIVPLITGAGIKIKTLEMLESGLHVVATPVGAEGITHENLHITSFDNLFNTIRDVHAGLTCGQ